MEKKRERKEDAKEIIRKLQKRKREREITRLRGRDYKENDKV